MNGKDLFLGMNYVKAKFIEEAETVIELKEERKTIPFRKVMLIAAAISLLAITITACAYAIQRISPVIQRTDKVRGFIQKSDKGRPSGQEGLLLPRTCRKSDQPDKRAGSCIRCRMHIYRKV